MQAQCATKRGAKHPTEQCAVYTALWEPHNTADDTAVITAFSAAQRTTFCGANGAAL